MYLLSYVSRLIKKFVSPFVTETISSDYFESLLLPQFERRKRLEAVR